MRIKKYIFEKLTESTASSVAISDRHSLKLSFCNLISDLSLQNFCCPLFTFLVDRDTKIQEGKIIDQITKKKLKVPL